MKFLHPLPQQQKDTYYGGGIGKAKQKISSFNHFGYSHACFKRQLEGMRAQPKFGTPVIFQGEKNILF